MKTTVKENPPPPPPRRYLLDISQEEMDMLRCFARATRVHLIGRGPSAAERFFNKTKLYDGNTWNPDNCFQD